MRTSIPVLLTQDDLRILAPEQPMRPERSERPTAPGDPRAADPATGAPTRAVDGGDGWDDDGPSPLWSWR
ncbi:hypothetical protein [Streptomyces sp. SID3343]|uniref:hypothetical protein n=1 Tax=Streptomyces sp. SID3343 TaxID=2690260 RepID=UPI00136A0815|nr:hypothetical protein [Streptomyces sp. SID3343]MYW01561.1 hypothetical protein [Streptomyces sp. SID3343]